MLQSAANLISIELQNILESKWFLIENWKWIALIISTAFLIFINKFIRTFISRLKHRFQPNRERNSDRTFLSYFIDQKIERGLSWVISALIGMLILENLELSPNFEKYLSIVLKVTISLHLLRLAYFAADASGLLIASAARSSQSKVSDQLAPLATKTLKVFVIIVGTLIILQNFGVNVTALLAGLGLGGVAIAFAAQDTVANLFGTITILFDSPFKMGDHIKIGETEGHVIDVGFRSTRIRTLYNSIITMPNSVVAKERIDNYTQRNNIIRFRHFFGFTYSSTPEQIEAFCEGVRNYLKQEETVDSNRVAVQIHQLADSSVNVLVNFHYKLDAGESDSERAHKYLMDLYKLTLSQKIDIAFPTRTVIFDNPTQPQNPTPSAMTTTV